MPRAVKSCSAAKRWIQVLGVERFRLCQNSLVPSLMPSHIPTERSFGLSVGSVCLAASALFLWRGYPTVSLVLLVVGGLLVGFALVAPSALRVPSRYWWRFAQVLGWVNTRLLLTLFFALVLTPVGVLMRLFGRNPLQPAQPETSWSPYSARRRNPKHYDQMF